MRPPGGDVAGEVVDERGQPAADMFVREDAMSCYSLARVPPGTTATLGLARGASIRITAAASR